MNTLLKWSATGASLLAAVSLAAANAGSTSASNAPAAESRLLEIFKTPRMSAVTEEVVKLAESGADASVILSYVRNSPAVNRLTADEIIHLRHRGVSDAIITAMIERGAELSEQARKTQPAPATPAPATTTYAVAPSATAQVAPPPVSTVTYIGTGYPYYSYWYAYPSYCYGWYPGYGYRWYGYGGSRYYSRPCYYGWPSVGFSYSFGSHSYYRGPITHRSHGGGHRRHR